MELFCEYKALEWLELNRLTPDSESIPTKRDILLKGFDEFVYREANTVTTDIDLLNSDFDDAIVRRLYDSLSQNQIDDIDTDEELFSTFSENDNSTLNNYHFRWGIFFLDKDVDLLNHLEKNIGQRFLGTDDSFYDKWEIISKDGLKEAKLNSIKVKKDSQFKWGLFKNFYFPIQSFCLVDRYLFTTEYGLKENFLPLLEAFIHGNTAETKLDIIIFTEDIGNQMLEKLDKKIREHLKKAHLGSFSLTLVKTPSKTPETHDRRIILDYLRLESGDSFAYFKNGKIDKFTNLKVEPLTQKQNFEDTLIDLKALKRIFEKASNTAYETEIVGDRSFRLFDLVSS